MHRQLLTLIARPGTDHLFCLGRMADSEQLSRTRFLRFDKKISLLGISENVDPTDCLDVDIRLESIAIGTREGVVNRSVTVVHDPLSSPSVIPQQHTSVLTLDFISNVEGVGNVRITGRVNLQTSEVELTTPTARVEGTDEYLIGYTLRAYSVNYNRHPQVVVREGKVTIDEVTDLDSLLNWVKAHTSFESVVVQLAVPLQAWVGVHQQMEDKSLQVRLTQEEMYRNGQMTTLYEANLCNHTGLGMQVLMGTLPSSTDSIRFLREMTLFYTGHGRPYVTPFLSIWPSAKEFEEK